MIRRHSDGSLWIPKACREVEDQLDLQMNRVPGELRWYPRLNSQPLEDLYKVFEGQVVNIVGKGPSLDRLTELQGLPTIGINEAVLTVEKLQQDKVFGLVQDGTLGNSCKPKVAGLICHMRCSAWYHDVPKLWPILPMWYGGHESELSAIVALRLLAFAKAKSARMLCFDSSINGNTAYATAVGYPSNRGGPPSRFLGHRARLEQLGILALEWVPVP